MTLDLGLALQILTLMVAAIGPIVAYRYARRLSLSENRQAWLNALRDDVAGLISLADSVSIIAQLGRQTKEAAKRQEVNHLLREKAAELQVMRFRIRLRLRTGNPNHEALIDCIERLIRAGEDAADARRAIRGEVVVCAETVIQQVWKRIERGR